jgi:hypothetical protein
MHRFSDILPGQHHVRIPHGRETCSWSIILKLVSLNVIVRIWTGFSCIAFIVTLRTYFIATECLLNYLETSVFPICQDWLWCHPPIQWVAGVKWLGCDDHSPPSSTKIGMRSTISLLPPYVFMAWTGTPFTWRRLCSSNWLLSLIYILFHVGWLQQTTLTTQVGGCGHSVSSAGASRYWEDEDVCTAAARPWAGLYNAVLYYFYTS